MRELLIANNQLTSQWGNENPWRGNTKEFFFFLCFASANLSKCSSTVKVSTQGRILFRKGRKIPHDTTWEIHNSMSSTVITLNIHHVPLHMTHSISTKFLSNFVATYGTFDLPDTGTEDVDLKTNDKTNEKRYRERVPSNRQLSTARG